jgi:hypothetical protein
MEGKLVEFDVLADRSIGKFEPALKIWPTGVRLTLWLVLEAVVLVLVALLDPRPNLAAQLSNLHYLAPILIFMLAGTVAAALALRAAIPGREPAFGELLLTLLAVALAIAAIFSAPAASITPGWQFIRAGTWCLGCTLALGATPWLVLFWIVGRGAPFMRKTEGALIGAAAFSFAFAASRLGCPVDDRTHVLVWHVLPVLAATALSISAGAAWLRVEKSEETKVLRRFHAS